MWNDVLMHRFTSPRHFRKSIGFALAVAAACSPVLPESKHQPMNKHFKLSAEQIRPLATGRGGAIASDRITVDGRPVGYMYRNRSLNKFDSGWAFLAGDESDAYMNDSTHHAIYDVNTIANYDPEIIPLLDAPVGSAFIRTDSGLVPDPLGAPND
jgi:hypothetical protein